MKKNLIKKIFVIILIVTLLPNVLFAAPGDVERIKNIYFENTTGEIVKVDYLQALEAALNGDNTLYNSIVSYVATAEANGTKIVLETDMGKILDYQKSMAENKTKLVDIKDDISYSTIKPDFTKELRNVDGIPSIVDAAFTSADERAELAVASYETASIATLAEIATAEGLKPAADAAVAILPDGAVKDAFVLRVNTRASVIITTKAELEITTLANAEATVTEYENAPIVTLVEIDQATNLKTTAESKVAMLIDVTTKAGFTVRITTKTRTMAVSEFNLQATADLMDSLFTKYQAAIGLDLTFYSNLVNKIPVQDGMLTHTPEFTTAEEIKAAFHMYVFQQLAVEGVELYAFNSATTPAEIGTAITTYASGLNLELSEYNLLSAASKTNVHNALLSAMLLSKDEIKTAFVVAIINNTNDEGVKSTLLGNAKFLGLESITEYSLLSTRSFIEDSVIASKPIADKTGILVNVFNSTVNSGFIGQLININSQFLGLNLTDYNALAYRQKMTVHDALLAATLTNITDLQNTFTTSVAAQKDYEFSAVTAFKNAVDSLSMDVAITTYIKGTHLFNYNNLISKVSVQETLLLLDFSTYSEFVTALDTAVAVQKAAE